jgi:hypothetical protein
MHCKKGTENRCEHYAQKKPIEKRGDRGEIEENPSVFLRADPARVRVPTTRQRGRGSRRLFQEQCWRWKGARSSRVRGRCCYKARKSAGKRRERRERENETYPGGGEP